MPKRMNGTAKWILVGLAVASAGAGIVAGYTDLTNKANANAEHVNDNKIDIFTNSALTDLNTEHRYRFEEKVSNMERDIALILVEVRK